MLRFKNKLDAVHHYRPGGEADSVFVENGQIVEAAGKVVDDSGDAYVVDRDGEIRAWPKARWELENDKPAIPRRKDDEPKADDAA